MGPLLFRYVGTRLFKWTAVVFFGSGGLFFAVALLERIGANRPENILQVIWEVLLKLPDLAYQITPSSCAIGAAIGLASLENSRELAMMRIIGVTFRRLTRWVAVCGAFAALAFAAVAELLLTPSAIASREMQIQRAGSFIDASEDFWLRFGDGFVRIGGISVDGRLLSDLTVFETSDGNLHAAMKAKAAVEENGKWTLRSISEVRNVAGTWVRHHHDRKIWDPGISPQLLASFSIRPSRLSASSLMRGIAEMSALRQNTSRYEMSLWRKLADTLSIPLLMLAGLWTVRFSPQPVAGLVQKLAGIALLAAVSYHFGSLAFRQYAAEEGFNPATGALVPLVLLALFVLARFARK